MKRPALASPLLLFLVLALCGPVRAADTPTAALKTSVDGIIALLRDPAYKNETTKPAMRQKLIDTIKTIFDARELAQRALAADWKRFSADQQDRFTTEFARLLQNTYLDKIESYTDEEVKYLEEKSLGEGKAEISTVVVGKGKEIPISYRMVKHEAWKVYDVVVEGVSLVQNYRTQFGQILMNESPEALIKKVAQKS